LKVFALECLNPPNGACSAKPVVGSLILTMPAWTRFAKLKASQIIGDDSSSQTKGTRVRFLDRVIKVLRANDGDHRTEYFFLGDSHLWSRMIEYGRLHVQASSLGKTAASDQRRTLVLTNLHVL
jgi:hypothetical protein